MIGRILSVIFGATASKAAGAVGTIGTIGAVVGIVSWLFGAGREWHVTLNALELSGVALGASLALEWARRVPPPGSP